MDHLSFCELTSNFEFNGSNAVYPGRNLPDHYGLRQVNQVLSLSSHGRGRDTLHELRVRCDRLLLADLRLS